MKMLLPVLFCLTLSACLAPKFKPVTSIGMVSEEDQKADPITAPPLGVKTPEPGVILSPHKPYSMLDVTGLPPGMVVKDPHSGLNLRVP